VLQSGQFAQPIATSPDQPDGPRKPPKESNKRALVQAAASVEMFRDLDGQLPPRSTKHVFLEALRTGSTGGEMICE